MEKTQCVNGFLRVAEFVVRMNADVPKNHVEKVAGTLNGQLYGPTWDGHLDDWRDLDEPICRVTMSSYRDQGGNLFYELKLVFKEEYPHYGLHFLSFFMHVHSLKGVSVRDVRYSNALYFKHAADQRVFSKEAEKMLGTRLTRVNDKTLCVAPRLGEPLILMKVLREMDSMEINSGPRAELGTDPSVFAEVGPFSLAYVEGEARDHIAVFRARN